MCSTSMCIATNMAIRHHTSRFYGPPICNHNTLPLMMQDTSPPPLTTHIGHPQCEMPPQQWLVPPPPPRWPPPLHECFSAQPPPPPAENMLCVYLYEVWKMVWKIPPSLRCVFIFRKFGKCCRKAPPPPLEKQANLMSCVFRNGTSVCQCMSRLFGCSCSRHGSHDLFNCDFEFH